MRRLLLSASVAGGGAAAHDPVFDLYSEAMPHPAQVQDRIIRVGPTRTHTTIGAGVTAGTEVRGAGQWALVVVDPGTYTEQTSAVDRVAVVGATGDPADVNLEWASPTGYSPLNTWGGNTYAAGFTSRLLPYAGERSGSGIYALHHSANGLSVFERMIFAVSGVGQFVMGMDGAARSVTWLIDCELAATGGAGGTNMHGDPAAAAPLRIVYDSCVAPEGVNYNSLGNGQPDECYVAGGSVGVVNLTGAGVTAVVDPAVPVVSAGTGVVLSRASTLPPRPVHGTA